MKFKKFNLLTFLIIVIVAFRNAYAYSVIGASSIPSRSSLVSLDN